MKRSGEGNRHEQPVSECSNWWFLCLSLEDFIETDEMRLPGERMNPGVS